MTTAHAKEKVYGLVDGAQYPDALAPWVLEFSPEVRSLFEGLPEEEETGNAAPILFEIDDVDAEWARHIDQMDRYRPCFTVIRSASKIDDLKTHLQRFLFADIGEGMQVLLRLFDPRSLPSILYVCGEKMQAAITHPMTTWIYRGGALEWQHVEIDEHSRATDSEQVPLSLNQQQLDELEQCDEPYALLSEFDTLGMIDAAQPYAARYQDFLRRYSRALKWGLTLRSDRYAFCVASYQHGEQFDQQDEIQAAVRSCAAGTSPLVEQFELIPAYVWRRLTYERQKRMNEVNKNETSQ